MNYMMYGETSFTMAYATTGASIVFAGTENTFGLAKNVSNSIKLLKEDDGNVWLYYNDVKQFALTEDVATGKTGLSFNLHRGGGANHILIINPFKVKLNDTTFVKSFTAADAAEATSTGSVSAYGEGNLLFNAGVNGTNNYTMPKFAFNAYASTLFTCTVWKSGSSFYYDVTNSKAFATTSASQVITITTKTAANGTVTMTVNNVYSVVLSDEVASGQAGWEFAVYYNGGNNALVSPITTTKGIDFPTFALTATTNATEAADQPGVTYNASLGQMVYLYTGANKGATAPVDYQITFTKVAYNQFDQVVFTFNPSFIGTITIGGKAITVTKDVPMTLMMKTEADGSVGVYLNHVKRETLLQEVATGEEGFTFAVTRTNVATTYQCFILKSIKTVG
jgi:hypothetical protein